MGFQGADEGPYPYCQRYKKSALFNAYPQLGPDKHFLEQNGRSNSWYGDFGARATRLLCKKAAKIRKNVVFLLSRKGGPRRGVKDCDYWFNYEFLELRDPKSGVIKITWVNFEKWTETETYWKRGDPDPDEKWKNDPRNPNRGGGGGNVINLLPGDENLRNTLLNPATALIGGGVILQSLPPAAASLEIGGGALLDGFRGSLPAIPSIQGSQDSDSQELKTDEIDQPDLGEQWPKNTPGTIVKQAMALPDDASISSDPLWPNALRSRDFGPTCRGWPEWATPGSAVKWPSLPVSDTGVRSPSDDSDTFNLRAEAGQLWDFVHSNIGDNAMMIDVIQTRLQQPDVMGASTCQLDVTIYDKSNEIVAQQSGAVAAAEELDIEGTKLPVPMSVWWTADSDAIQFRNGIRGPAWNSNSFSNLYHCQASPWQDDKRTIRCGYIAVAQ